MKYWMIVIVFLLATACSDLNRTPGQYIQPLKMEDVLWDMMLADRFIEQYARVDKDIDLEQERFTRYAEVFSIHNIDYETFKSSMDYYISRPDQLKNIYFNLNKKREQIQQLREQEMQALEEAQLREQDSLMNLQKDSLNHITDTTVTHTGDSLLNPGDSSIPKPVITDTSITPEINVDQKPSASKKMSDEKPRSL